MFTLLCLKTFWFVLAHGTSQYMHGVASWGGFMRWLHFLKMVKSDHEDVCLVLRARLVDSIIYRLSNLQEPSLEEGGVLSCWYCVSTPSGTRVKTDPILYSHGQKLNCLTYCFTVLHCYVAKAIMKTDMPKLSPCL